MQPDKHHNVRGCVTSCLRVYIKMHGRRFFKVALRLLRSSCVLSDAAQYFTYAYTASSLENARVPCECKINAVPSTTVLLTLVPTLLIIMPRIAYAASHIKSYFKSSNYYDLMHIVEILVQKLRFYDAGHAQSRGILLHRGDAQLRTIFCTYDSVEEDKFDRVGQCKGVGR